MKMKPAMKSSGVVKRGSADARTTCTRRTPGSSTGSPPSPVAAAKKTSETVGIPVANMWCAQTPKPMNTTSSSAIATSGKATILRCVNAGMIEVAIPNAGTIRM